MDIKLICGDPDSNSATYTRFILPFAYCPRQMESSSNTYYEEKPIEDLSWREKFLTYETAHVLFKKARWFELNKNPYPSPINMSFKDSGVEKEIPVCIKPPSLILFEFPSNQKKCKNSCEGPDKTECSRDGHNILHVGFLVVELFFEQKKDIHPGLDNLLELNELFRYWQIPYMDHRQKSRYEKLLNNFLANFESKETICEKKKIPGIYFKRWAELLNYPIKINNHEFRLFPDKWMENATKYVSGETTDSPGWAIYSDNRTFVWTCAIMEDGGNSLRKRFGMKDAKPWDFGHWIKLLNADYSPADNIHYTHESREFEKKWAEERTYKRWEGSGTFYGFNYHCGAMMGPPFSEPPLWKHFRQMYFDQIILLLYIRVILFLFGMRLNKISTEAIRIKGKNLSNWQMDFQKLRWSFALFTNLYHFPLLSNQQRHCKK